MKKRSILALFLVIAMLVPCFAGVISLDANAEPAPQNEGENVTTYVVKNDGAYPTISGQSYAYRFLKNNKIVSPNEINTVTHPESNHLAFRNVRSAMVYAAAQTWEAGSSLTILLDDDSVALGRMDVHYGAPGLIDGTILRADNTPLPVTVKPYGERTSVTVTFLRASTDAVIGSAILSNYFIFENLKFSSTFQVEIQATVTLEFKNCQFDLQSKQWYNKNSTNQEKIEETSTIPTDSDNYKYASPCVIRANARQVNGYASMKPDDVTYANPEAPTDKEIRLKRYHDYSLFKGDHTRRLVDGEYTAYVIFSGNTVVPENMEVEGLGFLNSNIGNTLKWQNAISGTFVDGANAKIHGTILVKDNAQIQGKLIGKADSKQSFQLGSATVILEGNAKVNELIGATTTVTNGSVKVEIRDNATVKSIKSSTAADNDNKVSIVVGNVLNDVVVGDASYTTNLTMNYLGDAKEIFLGMESILGAVTVSGPFQFYSSVFGTYPKEAKELVTVVNGTSVLNENVYEIRGNTVVYPTASIILNDRVTIALDMKKEQVDLYKQIFGKENFAFTVKSENEILLFDGNVTEEHLQEDGITYRVLLAPLSLGEFKTDLNYMVDGQTQTKFSLESLAQYGYENALGSQAAQDLFLAIQTYGDAAYEFDSYNQNYTPHIGIRYSDIPTNLGATAENGATISFIGKTLLMGDSLGIRLVAAENSNLANVKLVVNGTELAKEFLRIDGLNIDFFINAKNYNDVLEIKVYDGETLCLTLTDTVKGIAKNLLDNANSSLDQYRAKVSLTFIQAVQNYQAAQDAQA